MSETTAHYATCEITADGRAYKPGDVLEVHPGTLESMLHMGQASTVNPTGQPDPLDPKTGTPLAALNLPTHIVELLAKASISTVEQLDATGPMQVAKIPGLGRAAQKAISQAMTAFAAAGKDASSEDGGDDEPDDDAGNEAPNGNDPPPS